MSFNLLKVKKHLKLNVTLVGIYKCGETTQRSKRVTGTEFKIDKTGEQ